MRDQDAGAAHVAQQLLGLLAQAVAQAHIQIRERFVEQQQARLRGQRAGQGDALLLSAGEHVRGIRGALGEADARQHGQRLRAPLGGGELAQAEGDIVEQAQVGKQREVLEHHADLALLRSSLAIGGGHHLAVEADFARLQFLQACNQPEQGALATA